MGYSHVCGGQCGPVGNRVASAGRYMEVSEDTMETISALSEDVPFEVRVGAKLQLGSTVSSAPVRGPIPEVVQQVFDRFMAVFSAEILAGLPPSRPTDHRIDLVPNTVPPCHCLFRNCPEEEVELRKQLDEYIAHGWIEPAHSAFVAGILFANKIRRYKAYVR